MFKYLELRNVVEGVGFSEPCERDWREHEEFSSKKISVFGKTCAEKDIS